MPTEGLVLHFDKINPFKRCLARSLRFKYPVCFMDLGFPMFPGRAPRVTKAQIFYALGAACVMLFKRNATRDRKATKPYKKFTRQRALTDDMKRGPSPTLNSRLRQERWQSNRRLYGSMGIRSTTFLLFWQNIWPVTHTGATQSPCAAQLASNTFHVRACDQFDSSMDRKLPRAISACKSCSVAKSSSTVIASN